jgi:hypothetical protein
VPGALKEKEKKMANIETGSPTNRNKKSSTGNSFSMNSSTGSNASKGNGHDKTWAQSNADLKRSFNAFKKVGTETYHELKIGFNKAWGEVLTGFKRGWIEIADSLHKSAQVK